MGSKNNFIKKYFIDDGLQDIGLIPVADADLYLGVWGFFSTNNIGRRYYFRLPYFIGFYTNTKVFYKSHKKWN